MKSIRQKNWLGINKYGKFPKFKVQTHSNEIHQGIFGDEIRKIIGLSPSYDILIMHYIVQWQRRVRDYVVPSFQCEVKLRAVTAQNNDIT